MDAIVSTSKSKTQKIANVDRGGDRISYLPESVLHRILSLLPTKEAFATSILRTEWKCLWISIDSLDFWDLSQGCCSDQVARTEGRSRKVSFMDFVDKVLIFHDECDIQKFSLTCYNCDLSRIELWISWIIMRRIPEVKLEFGVYGASLIVFLATVFNYGTLEVLKLMMKSVFKVPYCICFSRLKTLHLLRVKVRHMGSVGNPLIQEHILRFPILEELVMDYCEWMNVKNVKICAPELKSCIIHDNPLDGRGYYDCDVKVDAKSLLSLNYTCLGSCEYSFHNLCSLVSASINVDCRERRYNLEELDNWANKFLTEISNAKILTLASATILKLYGTNLQIRTYSNLTHLTVVKSHGVFSGFEVLLLDLLLYSPNLESIVLPKVLEDFWYEDFENEMVPECLSTHLKEVKLGILSENITLEPKYGSFREIDLSLVKYFLKNAKVLEKMTIISLDYLSEDPGVKKEVHEQLLMLPKASMSCVIDLS
ncbi:hypothetical protein GIB67_038865 [Kingdonia uniflora]|uniref:FBD domain-containing protein n=1 Tax=Kingdonia uniflora TaxID=39325 RepID=A0A7J7P0T9_9MAGN|nr:hypothetical protein GIB67_038865 [Kingdonia uniflora]